MTTTTFDPIMLEVLWNRLISIVNEQAAALIRISFTTIVRETEDLSCGIFDRTGTMIAQAETGTPGHINSMATGVKHFLKRHPVDSLAPGDVLITNDPWMMSGHKHDVTLVTPIFFHGRAEAFSASTCHVEDIGGRVLSAEAPDVFEEGLAIPILKLYERGVPNETLFDIITSNVRMPEPVLGDMHAQIAANDVSAAKLSEFMEENGFESLTLLAQVLLEKSEDAMRAAIRKLPDGAYSHQVTVDGFDEPLTIAVTLHIKDGEILADYAGSSPQVDRGINVVLNYTHAYTTYPLKAALCPALPNNDGSFRPIKVTAPEGCVMNAQFPSPVAGRHLIGHMAVPAIFGALAKIAPQLVNAESSSLGITQLNGMTSEGEVFVKNYFVTGGMGARPTLDGLSAKAFPTNIKNSPVEVTENTSPLFISRKELIPDSGGAGKFRGGLGQRFSMRIRSDRPAVLSCLYERTQFPAEGYAGGREGTVGGVILNGREHLHAKKKHTLKPGDEVTIEFAGGGGYYAPEERDPQLVLEDVRDGLVSIEQAFKIYKVVISADGGVDLSKTAALRRGERISKRPAARVRPAKGAAKSTSRKTTTATRRAATTKGKAKRAKPRRATTQARKGSTTVTAATGARAKPVPATPAKRSKQTSSTSAPQDKRQPTASTKRRGSTTPARAASAPKRAAARSKAAAGAARKTTRNTATRPPRPTKSSGGARKSKALPKAKR